MLWHTKFFISTSSMMSYRHISSYVELLILRLAHFVTNSLGRRIVALVSIQKLKYPYRFKVHTDGYCDNDYTVIMIH